MLRGAHGRHIGGFARDAVGFAAIARLPQVAPRVGLELYRAVGPAPRLCCVLALIVGASGLAATAGGAGKALTPSAYRQKAGAICVQASTSLSQASRNKIADVILATSRSYLSSLRALSPPTALVALHQQVLVVIAGEIARLRVLVPQYHAGKLTLTQMANDKAGNRLGHQENALWKKLGVTACT
jgi:hypothetical protein